MRPKSTIFFRSSVQVKVFFAILCVKYDLSILLALIPLNLVFFSPSFNLLYFITHQAFFFQIFISDDISSHFPSYFYYKYENWVYEDVYRFNFECFYIHGVVLCRCWRSILSHLLHTLNSAQCVYSVHAFGNAMAVFIVRCLIVFIRVFTFSTHATFCLDFSVYFNYT